ncbi:MAG: extracellular solute-binding protein, partial [Oscillospiraceae bacterium]|nr:extracellular solute-binding protein [Oscillospiraceae bacterium]
MSHTLKKGNYGKKGNKLRRLTALVLCVAVFLQISQKNGGASADSGETGAMTRADAEEVLWRYTIDPDIPTYAEYISSFPQTRPDKSYTIDAGDFTRYMEDDAEVVPVGMQDYDGISGYAILTEENSLVEYEINVEQAGLYDISLLYYPIEGKSSAVERAFFVNGELPYRELAIVQFPRIWQNIKAANVPARGYTNLIWEQDNQGNDLKPTMVESPEWTHRYLFDYDGYIMSHLPVYFEAGLNTITINALREPMLLRSITLDNPPGIPTYAEYKARHDAAGAVATYGKSVELQSQNAIRTSSQMLYPVQDSSSPALTPSSPRLLLNNTLGGYSWRFAGQWAEWEFSVPETGYYNLGVNVRQNFVRGAITSRRISINGEVPFAEMDDYGFTFSQNWRQETFKDDDGTPFLFYLEADKVHTIRFESVLGQFSEVTSEVRVSVYELNGIYRQLIRLTGVTPDRHRDYQIRRNLPHITSEMEIVRDRLNDVIDEIRRIGVTRGGYDRVLVAMRDQLDLLIKDVEKFPRVLDSFKENTRACGNWLNEALLQPLQLDQIQIFSSDQKPALENNSFFKRLWFELSRLFFSFIIDYSLIGNIVDDDLYMNDTITLWIGSGRDQANIVKALIDSGFTHDTGTNVNVMLVDMNTLLQATLARQGPDVAIQVMGHFPMNYGLRNAVADLSIFPDLPEIEKRFHESAMVGFKFDGATYALPETQTFPMLFYRKDILAELGLAVPTTWDEVKVAMSILAQNQMEFAMMPNEQIFATLLYQNNGRYYNDDATKSALDEVEGVNAFRIFTEFYTDYKLERDLVVEERFRTGESPIIVADYTMYNNFQVSAPDLRG